MLQLYCVDIHASGAVGLFADILCDADAQQEGFGHR